MDSPEHAVSYTTVVTRALGRYELVRPLARGGMAEVFLARRRAAGVEKWLVVKRIRPERANDARFLDLFVREARLSMSLAHQNIVPVFDFGRSTDQVFLAMERVEGKDLGSSLQRAGKPLASLVAAFVAAECCQALDYAHHRKAPDGSALGIVHRDVTPRNVLLSWSGEVKLTDFGIAALAGDPEAAERTIGTPAYMAPEQARAARVDHRADVYALGLVLREALTGARARPTGEREATLALAKTGELAPWPDVEVPAALRAIVERATDPVAESRFADAHAMLAELDAYIVGERAARKVDAPARQLGAWLAEVWGTEREDARALDAAIEAGDMVSFLDDADLDVIGTGTERSMLATAADAEAQSPKQETAADRETRKLRATPLAAGSQPPQPEPEPEPRAPRRRRGVVIALGVVVVGAGAIVVSQLGGARGEVAVVRDVRSPDDAAQALQAPVATPDAGAPAPPPARADAAVRTAETAPHPRPSGTRDAGAVQEPRPPDAPAPVVRRKVLINSTPWSYFTIDSDPATHQTAETVELAPGTHVIHFANDTLHLQPADASVDVPVDHDIRYSQTLH